MLLKLCAVVAVEKKRAPGTPGAELEGVAQLDGERKRSVHSSRSWARTLHSEKAFGMPFAARALLSVRPKVICGHPTGRRWFTHAVRNMRGNRLMSMHPLYQP